MKTLLNNFKIPLFSLRPGTLHESRAQSPVISCLHSLTWPSKCIQQSTFLHPPWHMFFFCFPGWHTPLALLLSHTPNWFHQKIFWGSQNISIILFLTISLLVLGPNLIPLPSTSYRISSGHPDSLEGEELASFILENFLWHSLEASMPESWSEKLMQVHMEMCAALSMGGGFGRNMGAHP